MDNWPVLLTPDNETVVSERMYASLEDANGDETVVFESLHDCLQEDFEAYSHERVRDAWLVFFLEKFCQLIMQVKAFSEEGRDANLDTLRDHMNDKLFEILVCLFLTPEEIRKLQEGTEGLQDLGAISSVYDRDDVNGNREYLQDHALDQTLAVFMVVVSSKTAGGPGWRRIRYGNLWALFKFARKQHEVVVREIEDAVRELWREHNDKLSNVRDADGGALRECIVCLDNVRDVILQPCKHLVLCHDCAVKCVRRQKKCPVCKQDIERFESVLKLAQEGQEAFGMRNLAFTQNTVLAQDDMVSLLTKLRRHGTN